jgi:hypothetical protein
VLPGTNFVNPCKKSGRPGTYFIKPGAFGSSPENIVLTFGAADKTVSLTVSGVLPTYRIVCPVKNTEPIYYIY